MRSSTPAAAQPAQVGPACRRVPLTMLQKTAARRMLQSARDIPQFSVGIELNADELGAWRSRINAAIPQEMPRVSVTALLIWLTARALLEHPRLNARFDEDAACVYESVNMAVAIDTPDGLTAPVIRGAETLSLDDTARALKELAARAAAKRLSPSDFTDATFTLSNLGMFQVARFVPRINPPQAAILGVGGPRKTVQIDAQGVVTTSTVMELTVTADHRVLDGAEVARFLQTLRRHANQAASEDEANFPRTHVLQKG